MSKTLKQMLELYQPKSADEKKFVDKHVVSKTPDANKNGDDVFNGSKVKTIKRKETRHGYDVDQDSKVYEEVEVLDEMNYRKARQLSGMYKNEGDLKKSALYAKLADALHRNDKTTAMGFMNQIKGMSEEINIDEKLKPSMGAGKYVSDFEKSDAPQFKGKSKEKRRMMGIAAYLSAKKSGMKEEVEQVDELDKSTMRSYVNKAAVDLVRSGNTLGRIQLKNKNNPSLGSTIMAKHVGKRLKGIDTATKKLAYEEVDVSLLELYINLDEDNRNVMLSMIDSGLREDLLLFAQNISEHVDGNDN
jgi:hypothetical protein